MLTIFTTCKPCNVDEFRLQQYNAMKSWSFLDPMPQVLVMGNDLGAPELAEELGYTHVPEVKISDQGTPMLDDMFRLAEQYAEYDHLALISADVIVFQSVIEALKVCKKKFPSFCAVCRKRQQRETKELDFSSDWHKVVHENTRWNLITSGDFYMFNKGFWENQIPPFVIGRCACDSWLFWEASEKGLMIDLTPAVDIIDYQHQHEHWKEGGQRPGEIEKTHNIALAGGNKGTISDANWLLTKALQIKANEDK